jgi:glutaredoxin-like protein
MAMFDDDTKNKLKEILEGMMNDVNVVYFTQEYECETCKDTRIFLEELSMLSSKIKLNIYDFEKDNDKANSMEIDKIPAIALLDSRNFDQGIRFYGLPGGYEINSFIQGLLEVSGKKDELPKDILNRINAIKKDIHIMVFVTLACPYCANAVVNAHRLAMESDKIKADMVESSTFPHLAIKYSVSGVPKIIINEKKEMLGAQPIEKFLTAIESI